MFKLLFVVISLLSLDVFGYPKIPNEKISPGSLCSINDPDYSEDRYAERIPYCKRNVSTARKVKIYLKYNIPMNDRSQYTIDHIIPLALGGSNKDDNLWPEHKSIKATRHNLEYDLYRKLYYGEMNQKEAIMKIVRAKFSCQPIQEQQNP